MSIKLQLQRSSVSITNVLLSSKEQKDLDCSGSRLQFSPLVNEKLQLWTYHNTNHFYVLPTPFQVAILKLFEVRKIKLYTFWDINWMFNPYEIQGY